MSQDLHFLCLRLPLQTQLPDPNLYYLITSQFSLTLIIVCYFFPIFYQKLLKTLTYYINIQNPIFASLRGQKVKTKSRSHQRNWRSVRQWWISHHYIIIRDMTMFTGSKGRTDLFQCLSLWSFFVVLPPPFNTSDCKGVHKLTLTTSSWGKQQCLFSIWDTESPGEWLVQGQAAEVCGRARNDSQHVWGSALYPQVTSLKNRHLPAAGNSPWRLSPLPCPIACSSSFSSHSFIRPLPFFWQPFQVSCLIWLGPCPGSLWDS